MRLKITIDLDNAAFEDDLTGELSRVLRALASNIGKVLEEAPRKVLDVNGNTVGRVEVRP